MKFLPILFNGPMVRALLDGSKTQTRRVVKKPNPDMYFLEDMQGQMAMHCPYGQTGDQLWVRENGWERPELTQHQLREGADTWPPYEYDAEPLMCWEEGELKRYGWKRRPSIHMPRWASRIALKIASVRVERLQDISEADAKAEGSIPNDGYAGPECDRHRGWVKAYHALWESINGPGSWDANPWVWVVEFDMVKP